MSARSTLRRKKAGPKEIERRLEDKMIYLYADHRGLTYARKVETVTYHEQRGKVGHIYTRMETGRAIRPMELYTTRPERGVMLNTMIQAAHTLQQQILSLVLDEETMQDKAAKKTRKR